MPETADTLANDTLAKRLDRLETTVQQMAGELAKLTEASTAKQQVSRSLKTNTSAVAETTVDKRPISQALRNILERMGFDEEPISIEELQERLVRHGIRPEDNEFSRAIIEEREK